MPISVDWKVNVLDYAITSKMADAETAIERKIVECSKKKENLVLYGNISGTLKRMDK